MIKYFIFLCLLLSLLSVSSTNPSLTCKDEKGDSVDWLVALKFPKGYDFVYYTSSMTSVEWKKPKFNLSNDFNLFAKILQQTYTNKNQQFYAFYNDEPAKNLKSYYRGHLKGVINFDKNSGYWIIHSVPKFPTADQYIYNRSEDIFGQSFICINLNTRYLAGILYQLLIMQSTVYSFNLPPNFSNDSKLNELLDRFVINKDILTEKYKYLSLTTLRNENFIHIAKSGKFNNDLYNELVAPKFKKSFYVESWIRGQKVNSFCKGDYKVYNINQLKLDENSYSEKEDHSKWTVSNQSSITCLGDINRMKSQFHRGGGTLCSNNFNIWKLFRQSVSQFEKCWN